jgi:hypothetical protein
MQPCGAYDRAVYDSCRRDGRLHTSCMSILSKQCRTDTAWDWPDPPSADDDVSYVPGMWGGGGRGSYVRDPDAPDAPPCPFRDSKLSPAQPLRIPTSKADEERDFVIIGVLALCVLMGAGAMAFF